MSSSKSRLEIHTPTLISISIIAWALVNILHEIAGHAGSVMIVGLPVRAVSTSAVYININWDQFTTNYGLLPIRLFVLGGTIVNIVTGALALLVLRWKKT